MASIKFNANISRWDIINNLVQMFPDLREDILYYVGASESKVLKKSFLSGSSNGLNLKKYPVDKDNKRTVNYIVKKRADYVKVTAYPANFYENSMTRKGKTVHGKHIFKKFKILAMSNIQGILNNFDANHLSKMIDGIK